MTIKWNLRYVTIAIAIAVVGIALAWRGKPVTSMPTWLNYQGRLTQPDGSLVSDGSYGITFRLFESPTGGSAVWTQASTPVAAKGGLFQTTLGYISPFGDLPFDRPYWLEIEVEGRVLTPRQPLAAAAYAIHAHVADSLSSGAIGTAAIMDGAITTIKIADGAVTEAKLAPGIAVPVGSVVTWWGNSANVPLGWKLCDGSVVNDSSSSLNGLTSPDLRNRFVRGAVGDLRTTSVAGGADTVSLSVAQLPPHSHGVTDPGHAHSITDPGHSHRAYHDTPNTGTVAIITNGGEAVNRNNTDDFGTAPATTGITINSATTGISIQNTGGGQPVTILPSYVGLVYIMRVR